MSAPTFDHLKALVVEDNPQLRALLRSLLHALGIKQVYEAADGTSGFAELREKRPDFVLTDLSMEPMNGLDFTRMVRTAEGSPNPYVPIVMVTGHTERHRVEAARDSGVTEFLAKPITTQNLFLRITEIVDRPRPFVRSEAYFGPDRRRRRAPDFTGPWRRREDKAGGIDIQ
ncbi:MAG TPA: response regulator [Rhizomicrobium sp.]|jgi:CheY-like chemotaxis protein|nr:response regulator [Rhizomicrobium sp.]